MRVDDEAAWTCLGVFEGCTGYTLTPSPTRKKLRPEAKKVSAMIGIRKYVYVGNMQV